MGKPSSTLKNSPFQATPDARQYVPVGAMELARQRLMRAIDRQEGPAVLIGPTGTGKSLLCQVLAETYRSTLDVVLLADAQICTRRALLQCILSQLGLPYKQLEEGELRLSLLDRLRPSPNDKVKGGLLLIVDEAESYPSRLIDELRMIGGVVRDGRPRVRLVFAGNMRFEEKLAAPSMECLTQRIAARCYLHPLQISETREYLREHVRRGGLTLEGLLTEEALQAIQQATDGIPRLVNQLMDQAILTAEERGAEKISLSVVEGAWTEINQLPAPFSDSPMTKHPSTSNDIEFGTLEEMETEETGKSGAGATESQVRQSQPQQSSTEHTSKLPIAVSNKTVTDPLAIFAGNHQAIAFSHLEDNSGTDIVPCVAAGFFAGSGAAPWSFTQAAILEEKAILQDRSKEGARSSSSPLPLASASSPPLLSTQPPVLTSATKVDDFGDDFEEVIDLRRPVRVSTSGPLPWKGDTVKEAKWLRELEVISPDVFGPELDVHREILEMRGQAEQSLRPTVPIKPPSIVEEIESVEVVEELPMIDDRDMLVTIEDVPMTSKKHTVAQEAAHVDLDYRSIFSRLRKG